jgi:S-formylglutathione hydrolase FrmB
MLQALMNGSRPATRSLHLARWSRRLFFLCAVAAWSAKSLFLAQAPAQVQPPAQTKSVSKAEAAATKGSTAGNLAFEVAFPSFLKKQPISARVYVMSSQGASRAEPRFGPNWFRPEPLFALDVKDWKEGQPVVIDSTALGYPGPLDSLEAGEYHFQAVVRLNPDTHNIGTGEGNAYGPVVDVKVDPKEATAIKLEVDRLVPPRAFRETDRIKLAELESPLLSAFHHRPTKHRAAVILPAAKVDGKLPTVYIIPGFGGDHHRAGMVAAGGRVGFAKDLIRVVLDPDCGTGHHVFADSATNGPRGKALIEEFIPYLEKTFPMVSDPRARLLNGHSSGGWSSLWLQVTYPDFFGGTWSTSPDPADFRDFQRVDIYAPGENMYRDAKGERRPIARMGSRPVIFYDSFSKLEEVMGPGGQLGSFEAVFSPLAADGRPRKLWNRATGAIDPQVAKAWEAYDIRLVVERNWPALGPKLAGKIHVITGGMDTFYLEGPAQLLKESLAKLKSDAEVEIIPGRDHGSVLDAKLAERIDREMKGAVATFLEAK